MASPAQSTGLVRFGPFELDLRTGVLTRNGRPERLQGQPSQLLVALVVRSGELVTREQLRSQLWPDDTFVDFDHGLNNAVNRIREVLRDSAASPRYIQTVPRRGYRFIADVATAPAPRVERGHVAPPEPGSAAATIVVPRASLPGAAWIVAGMLIIAGLVMAIGAWRSHPEPQAIASIAILPLANLTGDPAQDYFADSMTDELITEIAKARTVRVISRTSVTRYKATSVPIPQIARELNVDAVVEGAVERTGETVRLRTRLIRAAPEQSLWANSYERDMRDVLTLQSDAAGDIIGQIGGKASTPARKVTARVVDPAIYDLYLRGRYYWNRRTRPDFERAIVYFNQAVARAPDSALAYAGLADCYSLMGDARGKAAAEKAVALDDSLAEAHAALAYAEQNFDWNFPAAEKEFRRAIELNPSYVTAHQWYSAFLTDMGRYPEAVAEIERAMRLDPLSVRVSTAAVQVFYGARQLERAENQARAAIELDPDFDSAHLSLALVFWGQKRFELGLQEYKKVALMRNDQQRVAALAAIERAYSTGGPKRLYSEYVRQAKHTDNHPTFRGVGSSGGLDLAIAYAGMGDKDGAFHVMEEGFRERSFDMLYLTAEVQLDSLHSDPRFAQLAKRIGLS